MRPLVKKITTSLLLILVLDSANAQVPADFELNVWPFVVDRSSDQPGADESLAIFGPLLGEESDADTEKVLQRPLFLERHDKNTLLDEVHVAYPLFSHYERRYGYGWKMLGGIANGLKADYGNGESLRKFEIWPLYWSYQNGNEDESYRALFPVWGTLKNRLFHKRISWRLFPLYGEFEKQNHTDYTVLYPVFRYRNGPESSGLGVWPLFGHFEKTNDYSHTYGLWPLLYNYYDDLDAETPYHRLGVLPFYARESAEGMKSETFLWPFFGYTNEWEPRPSYHEIRYFWPLIVQGRGEEEYLNRLAPIYTNYKRPNYQKQWFLWPLWRFENRQEMSLDIHRNQLLWFIWWDEQQINEGANFHAQKSHLWPIFSYWNDGAGTTQLQTLSPFEVFMPHNEEVRDLWSPLFALYRYEKNPEGVKQSLLWDLVSAEKQSDGYRSINIGPLFEAVDDGKNAKLSFLTGLIEFDRRETGGGTRLFWGLIDTTSNE